MAMEAVSNESHGLTPSDPEVDAFLSMVAGAQARFLAAVHDGACQLGSSNQRLRRLTAQHLKLTQHFLDGQRSIIRRSAEVERMVAELGVDLGGIDTPFSVAGEAQRDRRALEQEAALRQMLDDWWRAENDHGERELEDAETRAAILAHFRRDEPTDGAAHGGYVSWEATKLPSTLVAALDGAAPRDLDAALLALLDEFDPTKNAEPLPPHGCGEEEFDAARPSDGDGGFASEAAATGTPSVADPDEELSSTTDVGAAVSVGRSGCDEEDDELGLLLGPSRHDADTDNDGDEVDDEEGDPPDAAFDHFWTSLVRSPGQPRRRRFLRPAASGASMVAVATFVVSMFG